MESIVVNVATVLGEKLDGATLTQEALMNKCAQEGHEKVLAVFPDLPTWERLCPGFRAVLYRGVHIQEV